MATENNYSVSCSDDSIRKVYVYPFRFFLCSDCIEEEIYEDEFATLRYFFQSPKGRNELIEDREAQILILGKSMLPSFSEDRILEIAKKVIS